MLDRTRVIGYSLIMLLKLVDIWKLILVSVGIIIGGCVPVYRMEKLKIRVEKEIPIVRVLIGETSEIILEGTKLLIQGSDSKIPIPKFVVNKENIELGDKKIRIESFEWPAEISSEDGIIRFNGKHYRGNIVIHKNRNKYVIVNKVNIEDYLKGVVPCELRTPEFEALKAQAVACRSYALAKLARLRANNSAEKRECIYELKSTVDDQVYGGKDSETEPTDRAINETYGIVGTYNGKVINAGYHSTCGGKTNDGGEPYLVSRICHFCELSPQYKWEISSSVADISKGMGKIKNIEICSKTSSGRVKAVKVLGETGNHTISGEELRSRLGLKSCFFDIIVGGDEVKITGRGYGHGIGLCQYGAIGMASKGYDYKSILKFYFKGIRIEKIY